MLIYIAEMTIMKDKKGAYQNEQNQYCNEIKKACK